MHALILDFDGVVIDSMPSQEEAWRKAIKEVAPRPGVETAIVRNLYDGCAGERIFRSALLREEERRELRQRKDKLWSESSSEVEIGKDAREVLREVAKRVPIAIATTAPRRYVESKLRRAGLVDAVAIVVTDEDVPHPKPAPDMLEQIVNQFRVSRAEALMVGDTTTDYVMSSAAGIPFVAMELHGQRAKTIPDDVDRVPDWQTLQVLLEHRITE